MIQSEVLKGFIDSIILDVLLEKDNYGYEISKEIENRTNGNFIMKEATLYAAFKRLESKNLLTSYLGKETFGSQRKYYKITSIGVNYLNDNKIAWTETKEIIDIFLSIK